MKNNINHPSHYCQGGIECIEAIKAATVGLMGIEAVCTANAIKYLWRWKRKNGVEDLKKAGWYLNRLIKEVEDGVRTARISERDRTEDDRPAGRRSLSADGSGEDGHYIDGTERPSV